MSTTVVFTYQLNQGQQPVDDWERFRGIAKETFASFGGGEAMIRELRENFYGPREDS